MNTKASVICFPLKLVVFRARQITKESTATSKILVA